MNPASCKLVSDETTQKRNCAVIAGLEWCGQQVPGIIGSEVARVVALSSPSPSPVVSCYSRMLQLRRSRRISYMRQATWRSFGSVNGRAIPLDYRGGAARPPLTRYAAACSQGGGLGLLLRDRGTVSHLVV